MNTITEKHIINLCDSPHGLCSYNPVLMGKGNWVAVDILYESENNYEYAVYIYAAEPNPMAEEWACAKLVWSAGSHPCIKLTINVSSVEYLFHHLGMREEDYLYYLLSEDPRIWKFQIK